MPRKYQSTERFLKPDPRFNSRLVSKFINCLMLDGKKSVAQQVFYDAMDMVEQKIKDRSPDEVFATAVNNLKPVIEVRSKRVGGATYQVPIEVKRTRQQSLAFRWILEVARKKKGRPTSHFLAEEIVAAFNKEGAAMTIRENTHKMADANKMNAHFAW
ncbi:MAG: 30S ribosomal protein S7 [Planctomycetes bacterium]|nr:30S ribosomal protein S7 [Planctomycetota bacterium]